MKQLPSGKGRLVCVTIALLAMSSVRAAEIHTLEVERTNDRYHVVSDSFIDAPVAAVFDVLVDYDNFERISSIFLDSRFLERHPDGSGVVYTKARGCIAFFCQTVERTERLDVVHDLEIVATVIPERSDPDFGRAVWRLEPEDDGTRIHYEMEMELGFWVPPVIGPIFIKRVLEKRSMGAVQRVEQFARESDALAPGG